MTYEEFRELQAKKYASTDWESRESIHEYNEYCRQLRHEMERELERKEERG